MATLSEIPIQYRRNVEQGTRGSACLLGFLFPLRGVLWQISSREKAMCAECPRPVRQSVPLYEPRRWHDMIPNGAKPVADRRRNFQSRR